MNNSKNNFSLSLEELEKDYWKDPVNFSTGLVERCFNYRKIPLQRLTIEQLRTLIGQNIGLKFLIPLASEKLKENILAEGDFYAGDLLNAIITSDVDFWKSNPILYKEIIQLIKQNSDKLVQNISIRQFHSDVFAFQTIL